MVNNVRRMTLIIFLIVGGMCLYGCLRKEPVLSEVVQVEALTNHVVDIKSYKLPKGYFRGVFWPSASPQFEMWIVSGNKFIGYKELSYYIQAPYDFIDETTVVTDDWIIEESILPKNKMSYLVKKMDGNKAIRLSMPFKKQHFSFAISENEHGDEIVLFMSITEYVVDNGIFGYVVIKSNGVSTN